MKNKVYSVYFSPTHSTKTITETLSTTLSTRLELPLEYWDLTPPANRGKSMRFSANDILVLGLPVYGGRIPLLTEAFLHHLKGSNTPVVLLAVYGNRHFDDALLEMSDLVTKRGFVVIAAGAFIAQHTYTKLVGTGRPNENDLAIAHKFALQAANNVCIALAGGALPEILLPGNRPYKARNAAPPRSPLTLAGCTSCGLCAQVCPAGAIASNTPTQADDSLCIACHACVQACPMHLKYFNDETITRITAMLEENCTKPKVPALFF